MASTWKEVRDVLHAAIAAQWAALGYATSGDAKVHKLFPEHVASNHESDYFWATLSGGEQAIRAWAVYVANPVPGYDRMPETTVSLEVTARIGAWYETGTDSGAALETLQEDLSVVIQAIKDLGITLGDTVLRIVSWGVPSIGLVDLEAADVEGEVLAAEFTIVADEPNGTI